MPLTAFYVLDATPPHAVLFTFTPALTPAHAPREAALALALRVGGAPPPGAPPSALAAADAPAALARAGDVLLAALGAPTDDELAAVDLLAAAAAVLAATCEEDPPTPARVAAFYGKIVVCLHEAFGGQGHVFQRDTESVLRNAKLKEFKQ